MKAAEDFLELVLVAHVVSAAKEIIATTCSTDSEVLTLQEVSSSIAEKYVRILCTDGTSDKKYLYACEVITLGLLWYGYRDATREGDGERIVTIWKFLLLVFRAGKKTNYS